jgi:hypothetical protein
VRKAIVGALLLTGAAAVVARPAAVAARPAAPDPAALLGGNNPAELTASLRGVLLTFLPTPLYEDHKHWGGQKEVTRGLKWKGEGLDFHAEPQKSLKNDGLWWRVQVTATDLEKTLVFEIRDVKQPGPGKMTFTAFVAFGTDIEYERQRWDAGHRLLSTSIRGRAKVNLTLHCEATSRFEDKGKLIPDAVFRLRVVSSDFRYEHLKFEHVAGVGGEAAKLIGETAIANVHLWRPSLEQKLLDKANAAIVKGGDTKEVRVGLGKLFGKTPDKAPDKAAKKP